MDAVQTSISLHDLMGYQSELSIEIVRGEIRAMSPNGFLHHWIARRIFKLLDDYIEQQQAGYVMMDGLIYLLEWDEATEHIRQARVPDVSWLRALPDQWDIEKPYPGAPTLAVEVMSPGDNADEMLEKVRDYLQAGSEQVWVIYPRQQEVHQYRRDTSQVQTYRADARLDATDMLPGLTLPIADFFRLPGG